jgi:hypothetical protein
MARRETTILSEDNGYNSVLLRFNLQPGMLILNRVLESVKMFEIRDIIVRKTSEKRNLFFR